MPKEATADEELELLKLSIEGEVDDVRRLLKEGVSPNICDEHANTPLHLATQDNQSEVVEELLKKKALVDVVNGEGSTALHIACDAENAQNDCLILLIKAKANLELRDAEQNTALHILSRYGHVEAVDLLLHGKANVAVKDSGGQTPLHVASEQGHYEVVRALLDAKADQNARDSNEKRPRDLASDDDVIKLLTLWGNKALDKSFYKSKNDDYYDYDDDMDDFIEDDLPKGPQCSCGVHLVKGALFCQSCGKKQPVPVTCISCKIALPAGAKFCMQCGTKVGTTKETSVSKALSKPLSKDGKGLQNDKAGKVFGKEPPKELKRIDKNSKTSNPMKQAGPVKNGAIKKSALKVTQNLNSPGTKCTKPPSTNGVDKNGSATKQPHPVETARRMSSANPSTSASRLSSSSSSKFVPLPKAVPASTNAASLSSKIVTSAPKAVTSKPIAVASNPSKTVANSKDAVANTGATHLTVASKPAAKIPSATPSPQSAAKPALPKINGKTTDQQNSTKGALKIQIAHNSKENKVTGSQKASGKFPEKRQPTEPLPLPTAKRRQIPKKGEYTTIADQGDNKTPESLSTEELLYALSTSQDLKAVITAKQREVVIEKPPRLPGVIAHTGAGVVVGRTNTFNKLTDMTTKRKEEVDGSVNKSSSKPSKFPDKTESGSQAKVASKSRPIAKSEPTKEEIQGKLNQLDRLQKKRSASDLKANLKAKADFLKPLQGQPLAASTTKPSEAAETYMRSILGF